MELEAKFIINKKKLYRQISEVKWLDCQHSDLIYLTDSKELKYSVGTWLLYHVINLSFLSTKISLTSKLQV